MPIIRRSTAGAALIICLGEFAIAARAAPPESVRLPAREVIEPVTGCESLAQQAVEVEGAPVSIGSAQVQPATPTRAEFCRVSGIIAPQVQFELLLPTRTYTGRYLQGGCGGACGVINVQFSPEADMPLALGGAFAVAFENSGHVGTSGRDTVWARGDPVLRRDFAYRAAHVSALAAKALIAVYYGQAPSYSYFDGCSNGGREGLVEAQRYPGDFAGVIAGAPAVWITPGVVRILWESRTMTDAGGSALFTSATAALLHNAVLQACDALDGLKDGQLDDPRACHFDPRQLLCRPGQATDSCLTALQAEAARKLYQGPVDAEGRALYLGGQAYGTELGWIGPGAFTQIGPTLAAPQIRNMILNGEPAESIDWRTWRLDAAHVRLLLEQGGYYDAEPKLEGFRGAGGKLLLWQGAADGAIGAHVLPDYYQRLRDAAGSLEATLSYARAFIIPSMYHCGGGDVPYDGPLLPAMVNWVERGIAPEQLSFSAHLADGTLRTRPVYAYPVHARYNGQGDINDAASFHADPRGTEPDDHYGWVGSDPPAANRSATGDLHREYRFAATGQVLPFRLYVPKGYDGRTPYPLVVMLHGYGASADSVFDDTPVALDGIVQREAERHGFIVLAPSGNDGRGDYGAHLALPVVKGLDIPHDPRQDDLAEAEVLAAIGEVLQHYRIDRSRSFLMGNSMGMTGTLQLAQKYPRRWCAIGPSDGPPWVDYPVERLRGMSGAIFVNGDRDQIALTAVNRALAARLRTSGVDTQFVEEQEGEHGTAWYMALPQMFDYFASRHCNQVHGSSP